MSIKKHNFHSHTYHCQHAEHRPEDLIKLAIKHNFSVFAISEHMPVPTNPECTTPLDGLNSLIKEFELLKIQYQNQIKLYLGIECEYHEDMYDFVKAYFIRPEVDFLSFGNHCVGPFFDKFTEHWMVSKEELIDSQIHNAEVALESNMFSCFNHPDIFLRTYQKWDEGAIRATKSMIDLAIKYKIPLEFNLNGLYAKNKSNEHFMYPCEEFWRMVAGSSAPVIIGVDTHHIVTMSDDLWEQGINLINSWGLTKNLVDSIKFQK